MLDLFINRVQCTHFYSSIRWILYLNCLLYKKQHPETYFSMCSDTRTIQGTDRHNLINVYQHVRYGTEHWTNHCFTKLLTFSNWQLLYHHFHRNNLEHLLVPISVLGTTCVNIIYFREISRIVLWCWTVKWWTTLTLFYEQLNTRIASKKWWSLWYT